MEKCFKISYISNCLSLCLMGNFFKFLSKNVYKKTHLTKYYRFAESLIRYDITIVKKSQITIET
jgi:hypothetical protein